MTRKLVIKHNQLICVYCCNAKIILRIKNWKPNPLHRRRLFAKRSKYGPSKKIYAIKGVTSIVGGGCIN